MQNIIATIHIKDWKHSFDAGTRRSFEEGLQSALDGTGEGPVTVKVITVARELSEPYDTPSLDDTRPVEAVMLDKEVGL
jgi:hypothetical protein